MSVNKVILVGNLGKDPELRYTPAGVPVATFSMATTERFKDKDGNQQEKTEWHNIVVWRGLAEVCGKYLQKGKQVYIEGKIQTRSYDDRDGNKKYMTEIVAENMQMLSRNDGQQRNDSNQAPAPNSWGSSNNQNQNNNQNNGQSYSQGNNQNSGQQNQAQNSNAGGSFNNPPFNPDDDIPF